jgi:hypothetical protein
VQQIGANTMTRHAFPTRQTLQVRRGSGKNFGFAGWPVFGLVFTADGPSMFGTLVERRWGYPSKTLLAGVFCASYAGSLGVAFLVCRYWVRN